MNALFQWTRAFAVPLFVALISTPLFASGVFDTYGTQDGLSQSTVHCILQDSRGYLWIGTDDGLNRYDGTQFVQYHSDPADTNSLSNNGVWSLFEDRSGALWIGTQKANLNRFDRRTGKFYQVLPDSIRREVHEDAIICIQEDSSGNVWAGTTKSGLIRSSQNAASLEIVSMKTSGLASDRIRCISPDPFGGLLIGTSNAGILRITGGATDRTISKLYSADAELPFKNVQKIAIDRSGNLWLATLDAGVLKCVRSAAAPEVVVSITTVPGLEKTRARSIAIDVNDHVWVASANEGLYQISGESGRLTRFTHDRTESISLAEDNLLCLLVDRTSDLWVGTWSSGLARLRLRETSFHATGMRVADESGGKASLSVMSLAQSGDGRVIIGSVGHGLHMLENTNSDFDSEVQSIQSDEVNNATITAFLHVAPDSLIFGAYQDGLYCLHDGVVTRYILPAPLDTIASLTVLCMLKDQTGHLWLGTVNHGVIVLNPSGGLSQIYRKNSESGRALSDDIVYALFEDHAGEVWVGTLDGLDRIGADGVVQRSYHYKRADQNSLPNSEIRAISEDSKARLWVGTSNGLCRLDRDRVIVTRYTESSGLANSVIYGLLMDSHDNAWVSTNRGLSVIRSVSGVVENFYSWDGLPSGEFNQGACVKLKNGAFLFGGSEALASFFPDSVQPRHVPVLVTAVRDYQTDEFLCREPEPGDLLTLAHARRHIVVDFSAVEFYGGVRQGYAYRMEGVTQGWIRNVTSNSSVFTNLDPGQYRFEVRREGPETDQYTALDIVIDPPWWERTEAKAAWFVLGACVLWFVFSFWQARAQRKALADREREIQLGINRLHLLDLLAVFGHSQSTRHCLNRISQYCRRCADPDDATAIASLRREVDEYMAYTMDKVDGIVTQAKVAEVPAEFLTLLEDAAETMNTSARRIAAENDSDVIRSIAPGFNDSVNAISEHAKAIIRSLSRYYETNVPAAVKKVLRSKKHQIEAQRVTVDADLVESYCFIDSAQFEFLIDDLVANALEAMADAPGRGIRIWTKDAPDGLSLYIADGGAGIPAEKWDSIFQRKYTTKANGKGGMGLFNAKRTLERFHGDIRVHSSSVGEGTVFRLTLLKTRGEDD